MLSILQTIHKCIENFHCLNRLMQSLSQSEQNKCIYNFLLHFKRKLTKRVGGREITWLTVGSGAAKIGAQNYETSQPSTIFKCYQCRALAKYNLPKRFLTLAAPTPTNISSNSEPEQKKNGTPASPATALARSVFPVPGGPISKTP